MAEWIQAIAAVIGTVIAGLGFYYVVQQLIQNRDATKNQTRWAIAQVSCDVYRVFVDKPELALELFANESAPQRSGPGAAETTARLDAAAEMIFDYFEAIVESAGAVDQHTHNAWRLYMRQTLQASALLEVSSTARSIDSRQICGRNLLGLSTSCGNRWIEITAQVVELPETAKGSAAGSAIATFVSRHGVRRVQGVPSHALACPGGTNEGAPFAEFRGHCRGATLASGLP